MKTIHRGLHILLESLDCLGINFAEANAKNT